jgi:hypothetical protein
MNKLRTILKNLLAGLLIVWSVTGFAQADKLARASDLLNKKNADAARLAIDSVIRHPETQNDPVSWTTRAYVYFELYKRSERNRLNSPLRDTIVSSLKTSYALKPDADYANNNKRLLVNLSGAYFNMAISLYRDSLNNVRSLQAYNKSKELAKMYRPDSNFTARDIDYYIAVGSLFCDIFNNDNNNVKAQDVAKVSLLKALELEQDNPKANYNLGIMYYNQAVNLGKSLDYGADISQIDVIQESIIKLAKQSEQLIEKVHKKDPKSAKAIEALCYIYRMLNDNAKYEEFKNKCKELGIKVE